MAIPRRISVDVKETKRNSSKAIEIDPELASPVSLLNNHCPGSAAREYCWQSSVDVVKVHRIDPEMEKEDCAPQFRIIGVVRGDRICEVYKFEDLGIGSSLGDILDGIEPETVVCLHYHEFKLMQGLNGVYLNTVIETTTPLSAIALATLQTNFVQRLRDLNQDVSSLMAFKTEGEDDQIGHMVRTWWAGVDWHFESHRF